MRLFNSKEQVFIVLTWLLFELAACKTKQSSHIDRVKQEAENQIKLKMNDPDSYEFVEMVLYDSTLYADNMEKHKMYINQKLNSAESEIQIQKSYQSLMPKSYDKNEVIKAKEEIVNLNKMLVAMTSIKKELEEKVNEVASYKNVLGNYIRRSSQMRCSMICMLAKYSQLTEEDSVYS